MKKLLASCLVIASVLTARGGNPANPILFVTQVPMPEEVNTRDILSSYQSCVSPFSNHLGDTAHAGRGGSLFVRFANQTTVGAAAVVDLLAVADWSAVGPKPAANTIAVRNPAVNWTADKAIFSMVIGAPTGPADATMFVWQLFEITLPTQAQLAANVKPVLTKVANQPAYNNVFPTYALGGKIVFASDRPFNGQAHLTQREEYLGLPTVSGLWSLDPANAGSLLLLHHSPSGAFSPQVDSAGRLIFTNWDHLDRDPEAVTDSRGANTAAPYNEPASFVQTFNGSGNFVDESATGPGAAFTLVTAMPANSWEIFPEPRNFDKVTLIDFFPDPAQPGKSRINGNSFNIFLPWMINLDGTGGEILNHVGRHEVSGAFTKSFLNDTNVTDFNPTTAPSATNGNYAIHNGFNNFMAPREDPLHSGVYFGADSGDLGTHAAGRIVKLNNAGQGVNPDTMTVTYITTTAGVPTVKGGMNIPIPSPQVIFPLASPVDIYRTPVPLADGNLVASNVAVTQSDYNTGTVAAPATVAGYSFRLKSLKVSGTTFVNDLSLTNGLTINTTYWSGATQVTYNGAAWELDPAEVAPRNPPTAATSAIDPIEAGVFTANGVDVPTFQNYLSSINAALSVSRNVTKRDLHDRQQPFNLKISWSATQTTAPAPNNTNVYNVAWIQFLQADLRRGYKLGGVTPAPGRRVVSTPLHDTMAENVATAGAPSGSVRLGDDGSFAAILPAGKAMTWHLLDNDAAKTSQVKERFWVTFQKGEIRTCANCHGINTSDQTGTVANPVTKPTNPPQALATLLQFWKTNHPPGSMQHASPSLSALKTAGTADLIITRTGGGTGPVSVNFSTVNGTAVAGTDFQFSSGTLTWADGDTAAKPLAITLLGNTPIGTSKTFNVTLTSPLNGTLGTTPTSAVTIAEPPFEAWLFQKFGTNANTPAIAGPDIDGDFDGYTNFAEFAFNLNPAAPDPGTLFPPFTELDPGDNKLHLAIQFRRRIGSPGLTYHAELSTALPTWNEGAGYTQLFPPTDDGNGITETVKVRATAPLDSAPAMFLRLRVTKP